MASEARGRLSDFEPHKEQQLRGSSPSETVPAAGGPVENIVGPSRRPTHQHHSPSHLEDYVCYGACVQDPPPRDTPLPPDSSGTPYPLVSYITCNSFSNSHKAFLAAITKIIEPKYYHEVAKDDRW